jgi:hypothetical protein
MARVATPATNGGRARTPPPGQHCCAALGSQYLLQLRILSCQLQQHGVVKELVDGDLCRAGNGFGFVVVVVC